MQLIRKLLYRNRNRLDRNRQIRGLSTAELVGIIVIVGILGALGGTYVKGLVDQASLNAGTQNATTLQSVFDSAIAAGAVIGTPGAGNSGAANTIDTTSIATALADLNHGVTVVSANGASTVTYKMSPTLTLQTVGANTNYVMANPGASATFTFGGAGFSP